MSRWLLVSVALLAGLLIVQNAHAAGKHHGKCSAPGSHTVFQDSRTRVFTRTSADDPDVQRTVACRLADGRRFKLAEDGGGESHIDRVSNLSAVGRWLGYAVTQEERARVDTGSACALNLRTGKRRCGGNHPMIGVGVSRAGSLAWMTYESLDEGELACCQVYELGAGAEKAVLLDQGPDIEKDSFAVGGHRIYWTKAGAAKSATMP